MKAGDLPTVRWRKSTYTGGYDDSNCVEVAALPRAVAARDSKDPDGPVLCFTTAGWSAFLTSVKDC